MSMTIIKNIITIEETEYIVHREDGEMVLPTKDIRISERSISMIPLLGLSVHHLS